MNPEVVVILAGSDSDRPHIGKIAQSLKDAGIPFDVRICSAHKEGSRLQSILAEYEGKRVAYFAVAGGTDALSGTVSFHTGPVLSCPPDHPNPSCMTNPSGSPNLYFPFPEHAGRATKILFNWEMPASGTDIDPRIAANGGVVIVASQENSHARTMQKSLDEMTIPYIFASAKSVDHEFSLTMDTARTYTGAPALFVATKGVAAQALLVSGVPAIYCPPEPCAGFIPTLPKPANIGKLAAQLFASSNPVYGQALAIANGDKIARLRAADQKLQAEYAALQGR